MNRTTAALALGVLAFGTVTRAVGQTAPPPIWKAFGLQGISVESLATAPNLLCAGTFNQGVYCKDLPAGAWTPNGLSGESVTGMWIDPGRPNLRFAATGLTPPFQLYRTLDGGANWVPIGTGLRFWMVDGVPGTNTVYGAGSAVWRSDDLGLTWIQKFPYSFVYDIEVSPNNPQVVMAGGETNLFVGFTVRSLDGFIATWQIVWDSGSIGDNQTSEVSFHPLQSGLALTGHEGFILRTTNNGTSFQQVLNAPARFFIDWDGGNPNRAYAAGSTNGGTTKAFVSRDLGISWSPVTGELAPLTVLRVRGDRHRLGVAYAATNDGVYRFYGGGLPVCLDAQAGLDNLAIRPEACPPILGPETVILGDAIAFDLAALQRAATSVDLGEVECLIDDGDVGLATIDPPEPAPGKALGVLVRPVGSTDYGSSSDGLPRTASVGDCP